MKNAQIIFLHIPQPAETSLRTIVYAQYGEAKIAPIYPGKRFINTKEFKQLPNERKDQAYVIIGHISYGFHSKLSGNRPFRYATMVRDPIARCLSFYNHLKNKPEYNSLSLQELLNTPAGRQFINRQTSIISGSNSLDFPRRSTDLLKHALKNIESSFAFVGTYERFNESLLLAHHQLGWKIQPFETGNTSKQWPVDYAKELQSDNEAMGLLAELNQTDTLLYEYIETRIDDILSDIYPDKTNRLSKLEIFSFYKNINNKGIGFLEKLHNKKIIGWAKILKNDNPAKVAVTINDIDKYTTSAVVNRKDLIKIHYTGKCGFEINLPKGVFLKKGDKISAYILNANNTPLNNSPKIY